MELSGLGRKLELVAPKGDDAGLDAAGADRDQEEADQGEFTAERDNY